MPSLDVIANGTGIDNPTTRELIAHLESRGKPVARSKNVLRIIAPAVNILHARLGGLIAAMEYKKRDPKRTKRMVNYAFRRITDMYTILSGIESSDAALDSKKLITERKFARELITHVYALLLEIGGKPEPKWDPIELSPSRIDVWHKSLKKLKAENPLPDFARKENMKKGFAVSSLVFFVIMTLFFLIDTGMLQLIIEMIRERD